MGKLDGTGVPGRYPIGSYGDGIAHAIPELALRGELKAGFVYHYNPLRTNPNPKRVIAGYKKLDLLVAIDTVLSETASIAHYVLPESFYLERDEARHQEQRQKAQVASAAGGKILRYRVEQGSSSISPFWGEGISA
jgi:anaerobic selenocysteine-containing dehydrogenase